MRPATPDQPTDGTSWVVGSRQRPQGEQTLYVWAPTHQIEGVERQLGVELRLGMMDIAELHRAMKAWTAQFGATDRPPAAWEEFAGGARVEIAILMEPTPRQPAPFLLHGVDSIRALAAAVPAGRPVPVLFARAAPKPVGAAAGSAPPQAPLQADRTSADTLTGGVPAQ